MDENIRPNRRQLLSGIAGTIALPHVVASSALGKAGSPAASERITMGAIGVGGRGKKIMEALIGRSDCRMLAVCDVDSRRLIQARDIVNAQYGNSDCAAYGDYRELLARDDIDAVLIASPEQANRMLTRPMLSPWHV